ncbi:heparinase II/III family protein [Nonomuraea rosea]|uniref:Heparinase II/III family protein n=1 Tax=Nonomuraea rosea TaxID=638574 RepID=A0ABP6Y7Y8_9ACTN
MLIAWGARAEPESLARDLLPPATALPVPAAGAGVWGRLRESEALSDVRERARAEAGTPWPQPLASQYARFFREGDGNRTVYESQVFERQDRLTRAVLMATVTGAENRPDGQPGGRFDGQPGGRSDGRFDGRPDDQLGGRFDGRPDGWLDEVADGVVQLCEQSSWCWPAHEDTCRPRGTVLPDPATPCLDLGAADVAAQLAWIDQVLGDRLDARYPGLRERVRAEVRSRVLDPFVRRDDWHWLGLDGDVHNWCPWICGNILVAALRLGGRQEERARQVALAVAGLDRYLAALPDDGSVDEGYEYWWNGACRALEALDLLEHATSGALGAADVPVVRETARFPHRMHLGGPWYLNVADARARPPADQPWRELHRWGRRLGEPDVIRHARSQRAARIGATAELGRALRELVDDEWQARGPAEPPRVEGQAPGLGEPPLVAGQASGSHEPPLVAGQARDRDEQARGLDEPPLVAGVWLPGTQIALARTTGGTARGLTLAVKGGHNDEHHNHNDVGSVVVAVDGVPVLVDAGRPTYTAQTFGPGRYEIWTMRSDWHNVPLVRGAAQGQGRQFRARDVRVSDEPGRFEVRMDLAAAYPVPDLERWWRTAALDRAGGHVTIEDAWDFTGGDGPGVLHFVLAGQVERRAPGQVVVHPPDGARAALVAWDPARATAALTVRTLDDPMLSAVWGERLTRLELRLPDTPRGAFEVRVEACE